MPRVSKKKTTKRKAPVKQTRAKAPKPKATGGRPVGKTTGLGIQAAWVHIFEQNARAKKADRMTDAQISAWMKKEFPGRQSAVFDRVSGVRSKYNKGGLTQNTAPKLQSVGFDSEGNQIPPRGAGAPAKADKAPATTGRKSSKSRSRGKSKRKSTGKAA